MSQEKYTYRCPKCGSTDDIDVTVQVWARIIQTECDENVETDLDEASDHDQEFDSDSATICRACGYGEKLQEFQVEEDDEDDRYCAESLCCQEPEPNRSYCVQHGHLEEKYKCQDCGEMWAEGNLKPISDMEQRIAAGEPTPAGECPDCGALCHEETEDKDNRCRRCKGPNEDGEGQDGLCSSCADLLSCLQCGKTDHGIEPEAMIVDGDGNRFCSQDCHDEYHDEDPGFCTVHPTVQCVADGSGAVICSECMKTEEGRARL